MVNKLTIVEKATTDNKLSVVENTTTDNNLVGGDLLW